MLVLVQEEVAGSSVGVGAVACVLGVVSAVSTTSAASFFAFLFLLEAEARVLFNEAPVFLEPFCVVPTVAGEAGVEGVGIVKMGSPSSSNNAPVLTTHSGYFLCGLTLVAKFCAVNCRGLSGLESIT